VAEEVPPHQTQVGCTRGGASYIEVFEQLLGMAVQGLHRDVQHRHRYRLTDGLAAEVQEW